MEWSFSWKGHCNRHVLFMAVSGRCSSSYKRLSVFSSMYLLPSIVRESPIKIGSETQAIKHKIR